MKKTTSLVIFWKTAFLVTCWIMAVTNGDRSTVNNTETTDDRSTSNNTETTDDRSASNHTVANSDSSTLNHTTQLLYDLLTDYDKRLRPVYNQQEPVLVGMNFSLDMIRSFDDVSGEITLLGTFTMEWTEERLQWSPEQYGNSDKIVLPKSEIWHPELFLSTSLNVLSHPGKAASKVMVGNDGKAVMRSTDLLTSFCPVDVQTYPNDYQICHLTTSPVGYSANQVILAKSSSVINDIPANNEWDILEVATTAVRGEYEIVIHLKRRSMYGLMTMKVPIHILGVLNSWVFFLPPDSGERTSYSITTFLAFTVYMGILTDNIPKGSLPVANLMLQVFIMLIYSAAILFCTIVSLQIHTNKEKKPVPCYLQKLTNLFSLSWLYNRKTTVTRIDLTQDEKECENCPTKESAVKNKKYSFRRYSSGYLSQKPLPNISEKDLSAKSSVDTPCEPASYEDGMSWTHVGNVFDAYMLIVFLLWFCVVTIIYNI